MKKIIDHISSIVLISSFLFVFTAHSQNIDYKFNQLDFNDGLSNLSVSCFAKDELGFIWIGTEDGLNRYDGKNLKVYRNIEGKQNSITNNTISALLATGKYLWIGNNGIGIDRYNMETDEFKNFKTTSDDRTVFPKNVSTIIELQNKNILIGAINGLYIFDTQNETLSPYFQGEAKKFFSGINVKSIIEDDEKIWLGTNNDVFCIIKENKEFFHFQSILALEQDNHWVQHITKGPDNKYYILKQNWLFVVNAGFDEVILKKEFDQYMSSCMFDIYGKLWIIGDGLFIYDGEKFEQLQHDPLNPYSISDKLTKSILVDDEGIVWIGTWNSGISYFNPENERHRIKNLFKRSDGKGLPENPVDFLLEDQKKRIWIGTNWGGITVYDHRQDNMKYLSTSSNPPISADLNYSALAKEDKIWIGTFRKGLDCYDINTGEIENYPLQEINGKMPKINKILTDTTDANQLLLFTESGVIIFNTANAGSYCFSPNEHNLPGNSFLDACYLDKDRIVCIIDGEGLFIYNTINSSFYPFLRDKLSSNLLNTVKTDSDYNLLLIGTDNGLNVLDLYSNNLHVFDTNDGLSNDNIIGIVKDKRNYYWLSTTNGLCLINLQRKSNGDIVIDQVRNLNSSDGLVGNQFRERASLLTSNGKIVLGSNSGLSIFDPEMFSFGITIPRIIFSDIKIFNQTVEVDPNNEDAVLRKSIYYTDKIELSHRQNSISFDFTALDYFKNKNRSYKYKLEGFDRDWISSDVGTAVYTNLNPGNYFFKVKPDAEMLSADAASAGLSVNISPPFYQTKYFIFSSVAFLIAAFFTFYFLRLRYYKRRQLYLEKVVAERTNELKLANENLLYKNKEISSMAKKVHEADEMKLRFFSNVHHEFRTALSLIIGPVEQLKKNKSLLNKIGNDIHIISSNAKRLFGFVNEILEYRKIDAGKLGLNLINADAVGFTKEIKSLFDCKAKELKIDYTFRPEFDTAQIYFDSQKYEHIIFNLLSNAFKYIEKKGIISVEISRVNSVELLKFQRDKTNRKYNFRPELIENEISTFLEVAVIDNGIGFKDKEQIKLIWERFYRLPNKNLSAKVGSGIGLALIKELTDIHHGLVYAESNKMGGATFKVWFPLGHTWFKSIDNINIVEGETASITKIADVEDNSLLEKPKTPVAIPENNFIPSVLVIEDNTDIHLFLNNHLKEYKLWFKSNGKEGMEMAKEMIPDLIVCDIMLPDIQGYHIVKKLKNNVATSHIPIIMLTALMGEDNVIKALNIGADDYITKPFTIDTLKARINNLLHLREKLHEIYSLKSNGNPEEIANNPVDQQFFKELKNVILENIENYNFSVEYLAEMMGMNRIQLYRKVQSLTRKGPGDLIRKFRLSHSKELLKKEELTVSEVAAKVGYSEASSFSRAFIQEFKVSPSNYAKKVSAASINKVS